MNKLFRKKEVYIGVIPLMNLGNKGKVLSQEELVLLKKGHSSLGIEGNQKFTESNWLLWKVWTLEMQRLSDLSKFLKLLAGCDARIKLLQNKASSLSSVLQYVLVLCRNLGRLYTIFCFHTELHLNIISNPKALCCLKWLSSQSPKVVNFFLKIIQQITRSLSGNADSSWIIKQKTFGASNVEINVQIISALAILSKEN